MFDNFISKLFPKIILENEIISTIIFNLTERFNLIKKEIDETINTDI